jgi:hypothetical protein
MEELGDRSLPPRWWRFPRRLETGTRGAIAQLIRFPVTHGCTLKHTALRLISYRLTFGKKRHSSHKSFELSSVVLFYDFLKKAIRLIDPLVWH